MPGSSRKSAMGLRRAAPGLCARPRSPKAPKAMLSPPRARLRALAPLRGDLDGVGRRLRSAAPSPGSSARPKPWSTVQLSQTSAPSVRRPARSAMFCANTVTSPSRRDVHLVLRAHAAERHVDARGPGRPR